MIKHLQELGHRLEQTISPKMYQSLNILQMNILQLDEYIKDIALENPVLEVEDTPLWDSSHHNTGVSDDSRRRNDLLADTAPETLSHHLISQFDISLSKEEIHLLNIIIDHMDDSGYLTASRDTLAKEGGVSLELVNYAIAYIQGLDPIGLCAATVGECLGLQLRRLGYTDTAYRILLDEYIEDIAAGHYNKIARQIGRTPESVRDMCATIKSLNPKPGASFGGYASGIIIPDIIFTPENGEIRTELKDTHQNMRISDFYARLSQQSISAEAAAYLKKSISHAEWLLEAVENRRRTLHKIAQIIADTQRDYLTRPEGALAPVTLGDVARQLNVHESTVSRAVSGKTASCLRGTFPLKHFFSANIGGNITREDAKQRVRRIIDNENTAHPLSDRAIEEMLAAEGLSLSRRVIAKYRKELGIPGTSSRKVME